MKRKGNLYQGIISIENLRLADEKARRHKKHQKGVKIFDRDAEGNLLKLHIDLLNKKYRTSRYKTKIIREKKERLISILPYYPDRIVHHAVMNKLENIFDSYFTSHTYSCIKTRGVHSALRDVEYALQDKSATKYCLKIDIKKFYPNIDNEILKKLLRKKFKDRDLLDLLDEIIDSSKGLPIGNYLSQYFANFYLTGFDRWIKEEKKVKNYFRYMDDMVMFHGTKEYLHGLLAEIKEFLSKELNLTLKDNYQIFPVAVRGVDFVGYVIYHTHTLIRKSTKKGYIKMMIRRRNKQSESSYMGLFKFCKSVNLIRSINANIQTI